MFTRITNQTLARTAGQNLQSNMAALAKLQDQASSRKAISRSSDDPAAAAKALAVRSQQAASEQYGRNIDDGNGWLTTIDSSMSTTTALLHRVRDLTVQGANDGAMSPTAREAIAVELVSLRDDLLKQANSTYLGRSVYAGNTGEGVAFKVDALAPGGLTYTGAPGSTVERQVDPNTTVRVDADGSAIFGTGTSSVFALVDNIVADLRSGTNVGPRLTEIDQRVTTITAQQAVIGTNESQLERAEEANMNKSVSLEAQRSGLEDVDLAKVILDLQLQNTTYQASLAVTAKVLQPTLMDFLR